MKKLTFIFPLCAALALTACKKEEGPPEETSAVTTAATEPEADHSLVRVFTVNEIFSSLHGAGIDFSFPIYEKEFEPEGTLSGCAADGGVLTFPDGGTAEAGVFDDYGKIIYLRAEKDTAPDDFSAFGITFGLSYAELRAVYGIPDEVAGEPDKESGTYYYYGAGAQVFEIEFQNGRISAMAFRE